MPQTVEQALQQAQLYTDDQAYRLVRLPASAITAAAGVLAQVGEPFSALIVDKDEVTVIMPSEEVTAFADRLPDHQVSDVEYRLITFDVELEAGLVGFMARISAALAEAHVSILPYAAFNRDHVLVSAAQFDAAWSALTALRQS
ncbi:MAG: ACT domain-containing protein [Chloroflexi bacterium]|nr:ACT domain-containing protein [Chloroflexota bacterium]